MVEQISFLKVREYERGILVLLRMLSLWHLFDEILCKT